MMWMLLKNRPKSFRSVLSFSVESWMTDLYVVIHVRKFSSTKYPLSEANFFCFSRLKMKRSQIKNVGDRIERFISGLQLDIIAPNGNTIPLWLTKFEIHTNSTQACDPLNTNNSPAKISNNNSYSLYECFDNNPIKIASRFSDINVTERYERPDFRRLSREFATV